MATPKSKLLVRAETAERRHEQATADLYEAIAAREMWADRNQTNAARVTELERERDSYQRALLKSEAMRRGLSQIAKGALAMLRATMDPDIVDPLD